MSHATAFDAIRNCFPVLSRNQTKIAEKIENSMMFFEMTLQRGSERGKASVIDNL